MKPELEGIFPITPGAFTDKGEIDIDGYTKVISAMIEAGCAGITLFGIAGEYYKLNLEEEITFIEVTVDTAKKKNTPCIISNTRHSTEVAVKWAKEIEKRGADCMMVLPPFFLKPGGQELYDHMRRVSEAVSIPVMIQYAPDQTGVPIDPNVFKKLKTDAENILYYKIECKPPGHYITKLIDLTDGNIRVFVGNAGFQLIEGFDRGASGVMPGPSMFDIYVQIFDYYRNSKRADAVGLHKDLVYMLNHIRQNVEMIISFEKYLLKKRGLLQSDYCRQPTYRLDEVDKRIFEEIYQTLKQHFIAAAG